MSRGKKKKIKNIKKLKKDIAKLSDKHIVT